MRRSKTLPAVLKGLESIARGEVIGETAAEIAPRIQSAMLRSLKPHRRTGAAERVAVAIVSGSKITLENAGYAKFIRGYVLGKRLPNNWIKAIKSALNRKARAALRGIV